MLVTFPEVYMAGINGGHMNIYRFYYIIPYQYFIK
jgi:hypothetical protein